MRWLDRLLCLVYGHTWESVCNQDAKSCVHCELKMNAFDLRRFWRRRQVWIMSLHADSTVTPRPIGIIEALRLGWPRRTWSGR